MKSILFIGLIIIGSIRVGFGQVWPLQPKYVNLPVIADVLNDYGDKVIGMFIYDQTIGYILTSTKQIKLADGSYETTFELLTSKNSLDYKLWFNQPVLSVNYSLKEGDETLKDSLNKAHTFYEIKTSHPTTWKYGNLEIVIKSKYQTFTFFDRVSGISGTNRSNFIKDKSYKVIGGLIIDKTSKVYYNDIVNIYTQVKQPDGLYKTTFRFDVMVGGWGPKFDTVVISNVNIGLKFNTPPVEVHYISLTKSDTTKSGYFGITAHHVAETLSANKLDYRLKLDEVGNSEFEIVIVSKVPLYTTINGVGGRNISVMTW